MIGSDSYSLNFFSCATTPLAYIAGKPVALGQFRADVEALLAQFERDGDTLITCPGRYALGTALLASLISNKTVILPPNNLDQTLKKIRQRFNVGFECNVSWASSLLNEHSVTEHGNWDVQLTPGANTIKLFTSGSSGDPKVVTKSVANLFDEAYILASMFDWPAGAIVGSVPVQHAYGLTFSLLLPWALGQPWVDEIPHFPGDIYHVISKTQAKTLISVPAQFQAMLEDCTELRNIFCVTAAAPLQEDLARQWELRNGAHLLEIYGSTETGVVAHRQQMTTKLWQTFPQVGLAVEEGRLKVNSPFVSKAFQNGFLTADRVSLLNRSQFALLGRIGKTIKIAGNRVSLTEVELTVNALPGILEAAVFAVPAKGSVRDFAIWAVVVPTGERDISPQQLQAALRDKLQGVEVPRRILVVDKLPRSVSGKLPRDALIRLFDEHDAA